MNGDDLQETIAATHKNIDAACKKLIQFQRCTTQSDIRDKLTELGYKDINQSTISRMLSRLGVVKVTDAYGKNIYSLSSEEKLIHVDPSVSLKIQFITHNQSVVVVKTHPGCAQFIARLIDIHPHQEILGSVSGNDMVIIAPKSIHRIDQCETVIRDCLGITESCTK